jgi:hypothetical protein
MALRAKFIPEKAGKGHGKTVVGLGSSGTPKRAGHPFVNDLPLGDVALTTETGLVFQATLDGPVQEGSLDIGWEEIDRPKNQKALNHTQEPLDTWVLPILFEGWNAGASVEGPIAVLQRMVKKPSRTEDPPPVHVHGVGPISSTRDWAITNLEPQGDEKTLWAGGRNRRRARYDVTITERELPEVVKVRPAKSTRDRSGKHGKRTYTVKSGDTGQRIALRELGDASRWRDLEYKGKKIRDPNALKRGQKLTLP